MAWRGAASRTVSAAVRRSAPSVARSLRSPPPLAAPAPRLPSAFANSSSLCPLAAARPLAAMMGSPLTAAVLVRLTAHPPGSARSFFQHSQGAGAGAGHVQFTNFPRSTGEDCKQPETGRAGVAGAGAGAGHFQVTNFPRSIGEDYKQPETGRVGLAGASNFHLPNFIRDNSDTYKQSPQIKKRDFIHILMMRKKTFVTVTDAKGNKKTGASAGCLEERKGRSLSRYAAEATAEHVGRSARKMGLRSVVVKVKGTVFFKRKKKVILSWSSGFRDERVRDRSPVMYIHDVTQLPHNGCRLPKKRRI